MVLAHSNARHPAAQFSNQAVLAVAPILPCTGLQGSRTRSQVVHVCESFVGEHVGASFPDLTRAAPLHDHMTCSASTNMTASPCSSLSSESDSFTFRLEGVEKVTEGRLLRLRHIRVCVPGCMTRVAYAHPAHAAEASSEPQGSPSGAAQLGSCARPGYRLAAAITASGPAFSWRHQRVAGQGEQ